MKKLNLIIVFIISTFGSVIAQDQVYYTRNASLNIHGEFQGESLHGTTKQLGITLDYETTEISLKLNLKNLIFDVDSLNKMIQANHQEIEFKGTLSLEHINTDDHPPLKFTMEGWAEIGNEKKKIEGKGELHHIDQSENFACMLGMTINLNLDNFGIEVSNLENEIEVVIKQALLKADKN